MKLMLFGDQRIFNNEKMKNIFFILVFLYFD